MGHAKYMDGTITEDCGCWCCRNDIHPGIYIKSCWSRFSRSFSENLSAVFSPEGFAFALSAILTGLYYGFVFTLPVYVAGLCLGDFYPAGFNAHYWDLKAAWGLSTLCILLIKSITFTVREEGEEE